MLSVVNLYSLMSKMKHDVLRAEYISMYILCIVSDCAPGVPSKADGPGSWISGDVLKTYRMEFDK